MKKHITLPLTKEATAQLRAGDSVLLSGTLYTARDAAHKRLTALLDMHAELPFSLKNATIYYVGPTPPHDGMALGSAGPTTSVRCDPYTPQLLEAGVTAMIGKGKRGTNVKEALQKHNAVYLAAIGGAGALLSRCIKSAEVIAFEDLGTEAIRKLHVENFPAVVINDCFGGDYYESARDAYLQQYNK
jgi:fumarate hydratase subunit beta